MVIAVDLDNTLNDLQKTVLEVFNACYDTTYCMDDFTHYNMSDCLNKEDALKFVSLYSKTGIYDAVHPLADAQNLLYKLYKAGHEIYIVTHTIPSIYSEKCNWIKYYFNFIDDAHIVAMKNKWLFKADVMIEDNLDNLLSSHYYDRVLFDYPWNRNVRDEVYSIHRVSNWQEAFKVINKINQLRSDGN